MNITLRVLLMIFSLLYFGYTIYQVRKASLNIEDAIFPIIFSLLCIFMSIFTKLIAYISDKLGFISISNFVLVFVILVLSIYNLKIVTKYSKLNENVKKLNHFIALKDKENKKWLG